MDRAQGPARIALAVAQFVIVLDQSVMNVSISALVDDGIEVDARRGSSVEVFDRPVPSGAMGKR